ncbi:hypothetical protein SAMN05216327_103275 [Dyadobacter sp. SG02]|uniref:hypothetical protein n=1 Tax=Dyadobacter sp. SG02 TaxID=1855291 RepID=UPI0008BA33C5|nr:hypothetical protein [Dyadobacter sp. SG02]SEI69193.1 hypothetical protein SAMN05216327_103275 [Dyadobacter sp. SG02]
MRTEKWLVLCVVLLLIQLVACERGKMEENAPVPVSARTGTDSVGQDSIPRDTIVKDSIEKDTIYQDTIVRDSTIADSTFADSTFVDSMAAQRRSALPAALGRLRSVR